MNDDDVDFKPSQSTSSNLTSLFDTNKPRPSENQTLTYTPPKPPKAGEDSGTPVRGSGSKSLGNEKLGIIISKNIQLYKLENGKYVGQGAAGIAIIGNFDYHIYQIILYKNNKEYLSKTHIQPNFTFTVLENNYASFYDTARQNWSVLFPSSSDIQQFAKQLAISKYNSQIKQELIIVQDLIPIGSVKANKHDIVKLEYSCSLLNKDDFTPLKEKSKCCVEISEIYTFPWQEGLKDCYYKCKRIVITPFKLSAPWMNEIHESNSVLVEFEVESINQQHLAQNKRVIIKSKIQDESTTDSSVKADTSKEKPVSIQEKIFLSKSHKADIISRIAKMGQALPLKVIFSSGPDDSSVENSSSLIQENNSKDVYNMVQHQQIHQIQPSNCVPCSPQPSDTQQSHQLSGGSGRKSEYDVTWQQQQTRGGMNFAYQELHPLMSAPPDPSEQSYARGSEAIGTDAELRISINKVSEKVDHVLNRLQNLDASGWERVKTHQSAVMLDPVNVINSIQEVMAENENLKVEIQQQKSKIKEQGNKLHSLMELTQRCVERCAYPDRKPTAPLLTDQSTGPDEEPNMTERLSTGVNTRINELTCEIEKYRKEIGENQQQISQYKIEVLCLIDKLKKRERDIYDMETKLNETVTEKEALLTENDMYKKEIQRYEEDSIRKNAELNHSSTEDSIEEIKKVMNAANRKLQSCFTSDKFYSGKDIKEAITRILKDVTMEYVKYKNKQKAASVPTNPVLRRVEPDGEQQSAQTTANVGEERELSVLPTVNPNFFPTPAPNAHSSDLQETESSVRQTAADASTVPVDRDSSIPWNNEVRAESCSPIISIEPVSDAGVLARDGKSVKAGGVEAVKFGVPCSSTEEMKSKGSSAALGMSSTRTSTAASEIIRMASRLPSREDEEIKKDITTKREEQDWLKDDNENENMDFKKSVISVVRYSPSGEVEAPKAHLTTYDSIKTNKVQGSAALIKESPDVAQESMLLHTSTEWPSDTGEIKEKILNIRSRSEALSEAARIATDGREKPDETDVNREIDAGEPVKKGKSAKKKKSPVSPKKTMSKPTKDTPAQVHIVPDSSLKNDYDKVKSQLQDEEKVYTMAEESHLSKENEKEKDEGEKRTNDEKAFSPDADENFKSSGSNAAHESSSYGDYYQGWESSKPPPLPLDDDEKSSETDEEWL